MEPSAVLAETVAWAGETFTADTPVTVVRETPCCGDYVTVRIEQADRVWYVTVQRDQLAQRGPGGADSGRREAYRADRPMPARFVRVGATVCVPEWVDGSVAGWVDAQVLEIGPDLTVSDEYRSAGHWTVVVRLLSTGQEARYWPYSIMCGVCRGRDDVTCHQCPRDQDGVSSYALRRRVAS